MRHASKSSGKEKGKEKGRDRSSNAASQEDSRKHTAEISASSLKMDYLRRRIVLNTRQQPKKSCSSLSKKDNTGFLLPSIRLKPIIWPEVWFE